MKRTVAAVLTAGLCFALLGGLAFAHAHYKTSTPSPGQTLSASPASVVIMYDSELGTGSTGTVSETAGATVSTGATVDANDRTKLTIALKPSLPNGVYKINWHSVSADDGDELDGSFFFGVGVPAPSTATAPNPAAFALLIAGLLVLVTSVSLLPARLAPR